MEQTNWKPTTEQPELHEGDGGWLVSAPVLGYCSGQILVVTLELIDEVDGAPCWYSNCSEHWSLGTKVTHWAPLPEPPNN